MRERILCGNGYYAGTEQLLEPSRPTISDSHMPYSTVTLLARLRGWSTWHPRMTAM